ncbi:MAG TPA: zinc-binding dehydrogenase [Planctomycetota bacterium]|nr:zinc-binding dehydrogenase [Planctomycetota bacterium]
MKAVVIRKHGGTEVLEIEDRPVPEPGPGEVRVRVRAVALNHLDVWVRRGIPGHPFPLPIVPGCDVAGEVEAIGPGAGDAFRAGAPVVVAPGVSCGACEDCASGQDQFCRRYGILGEHQDGGCAEAIVVPARNLLPAPTGMPAEQAAAIPLVFITAWHMVVERARVKPGETVLVHAAGSGVSSAAIQIARLHGARVITTVGSDAKVAKARALGADDVVNYRTQDFAAEVRRLTGKRGADAIIDHVGPATWEGNVKSLARGGRLVVCGSTSGFEVTTDLRFVFFKSLSLMGSTMGSRAELHSVLRLVEAGRLKPVVDTVLPLDEVAEGHRRLEAREVFGKIVLRP